MSGPLVSVVIPAYNAAHYIAATLTSVLKQTFSDFEVIVVNDGSPDPTALERALQPYVSRICYIKQANGGPSAARNVGILQARGKYIAFLDSDERVAPRTPRKSRGRLAEGPQPRRDLLEWRAYHQ